jgi:hypothetical protein
MTARDTRLDPRPDSKPTPPRKLRQPPANNKLEEPKPKMQITLDNCSYILFSVT